MLESFDTELRYMESNSRAKEWFRNILDDSIINTCFENHTKHTPIAACIISALWPDHVVQLANEFQVDYRLTFAMVSTFNQPALLHHMNIRSTDTMGGIKT